MCILNRLDYNTRTSELVKFWATNRIRRPTNLDPVLVQSDAYSYNQLFHDNTSYLILNILNIITTLFRKKIIDPRKYITYSIITHFTPFYIYVLHYVHYEKFNIA